MRVAIDYVINKNPELLDQVFGLRVAIFNWLKAYLRYGRQERFYFLIDEPAAWREVQELAASVGCDPARLTAFDRRFVQENYNQFSTIFRADPVAQELLWRREKIPDPGYNFCGLAHAISGLETGTLLEQYCLSPAQKTDAIICPSRAVQSSIRSFLDLYAEYIEKRFNTTYRCPIQLPLIPLGIDVDKFEKITTPAKRAEQRVKLGLTDQDIVILWVGRLSHSTKAHPLAMFQSAERAAIKTGARVHLIMLGYFAPETDEPHFRNLAKDICKLAQISFISHKDPRFPDGLWAAGDIFISLVDNFQESYGLTPIEAMAAGLPRVISDWDGYKDSVEQGVDGFLVTTRQPPPGQGEALSDLLLSGLDLYAGYLAKAATTVTIDQEEAANHLATLINDPELRKSFAARAREKARKIYDWRNIIPRMEDFWAEMAAQRRKDCVGASRINWPALPPQAPDPYTMYASYPTKSLGEDNKIELIADQETTRMLWRHELNVFSLDIMIHPDRVLELIATLNKHGPMTIGQLKSAFARDNEEGRYWRTVAWLIKLGIVGILPHK
ncbi:MAG: glycosyltransferase family 4 protein [Bdellovibrionales bacterium]